MKKQNTEKKLSLNKLQMAKLTNLNVIKGGDDAIGPDKTIKDKTKLPTILTK